MHPGWKRHELDANLSSAWICRGEVVSLSPYPTGYNPPYITTVENSTDTGAATGPLYVTKSPVGNTGQQELDLAEFFPTAVGQTGYVSGGYLCSLIACQFRLCLLYHAARLV